MDCREAWASGVQIRVHGWLPDSEVDCCEQPLPVHLHELVGIFEYLVQTSVGDPKGDSVDIEGPAVPTDVGAIRKGPSAANLRILRSNCLLSSGGTSCLQNERGELLEWEIIAISSLLSNHGSGLSVIHDSGSISSGSRAHKRLGSWAETIDNLLQIFGATGSGSPSSSLSEAIVLGL